MPDLPFNEGDRVVMDDRHGRVISWNHDDPDHVIYLVAFDEALHEKDGDEDITVRTAWVEAGYLDLVETGVAWALRRRDEIMAGTIDQTAVAELQKLKALHDKWAGVDPMADIHAARAREVAASFGQPVAPPERG